METHALRGLRLPLRNPNPITPHSRSAIPSRSRRPVHCAVRFRPCIDIHKGKVKQIVGSTLRDSNDDAAALITNFESDKSPAEFARLYKHDGLTGGHVIMLGADDASRAAAIEALHAYPGGMQLGGGINLDNASSYLEEGASHVIVTSFVFRDGQMDLERLKDLVEMIGKHRLVLDLSCRKKNGKYAIVTDRWQKFSDVFLDEQTLKYLATHADEFLVHGVDVEGKKQPAQQRHWHRLCSLLPLQKGTEFQALRSVGSVSRAKIQLIAAKGWAPIAAEESDWSPCDTFELGIDEELVALLGRYSPIPVTYAGGVTTIADMDRIKAAGGGRVDATVGSALDIFGGDLPYDTVVAWHAEEAMTLH